MLRRSAGSREQNHLVDDELRNPQIRDRNDRSRQAEHDHQHGVDALRLPDETDESRNETERYESLTKRRLWSIGIAGAAEYDRMCHRAKANFGILIRAQRPRPLGI